MTLSRERGGKRKYTMSERAREQRRAAPWKHGQRASSALGQAVHPCKRSVCPMSDEGTKGNCQVKQAADGAGRALEICPVRLAMDPERQRLFVEAVRSGDIEGLAELQGRLLAGGHQLAEQELARLLLEGLTVEFDVLGPNGGTVRGVKVNPRADPTLKLLDLMGATASQQAVTPKAAGERKRDLGVGGLLDLYRERARIAGATGGG